MGRTTNQIITLLAALLVLGGCAMDGAGAKGDGAGGEGKEDRWNWVNNPERFDSNGLNYHFADLPTRGAAEREAWRSTYWPTYDDSIQARWQHTGNAMDDLSPAEKYDMAFNDWTPSEEFLALRPFDRNRPVPETDWDPAYYDQLGPLASHVSRNMGNRRDREMAIESGGRPEDGEWDVETWWGLCHAWVPAALLEDRPLRPVTYNGVTFEVGDMEALLIAAYNRAGASMIGGRCNVGGGDDEVERDEHGRAVDVECRDTNPGAMHVILSNYLGMRNRGFAMDRTFDYEVWNQPIESFEVTRNEEITVAEANELLGRTGDTYELNEDAATLYRIHSTVRWVTESHASTVPSDTSRYTRSDYYTYILEVDADGRVIGGEWFGNSRETHPDFLWDPQRLTRSSVPNLSINDVRMLIEMSRQEPTTGGGDDQLVAMGQGDIAIPDNDANGVASTATLSGEGVVASVTVDLDVTHTYIGDLLIELEHGGVTRTVHNREGGSADDIDESFTVVGFEGADPNGDWILRVSDHAGRDVGTLDAWSLRVGVTGGTPEPPPVDDAQRFAGQGGIDIPDNDANGVTSTAQVSGVSDGDVSIEVEITHTYVGDLIIEVEHQGRTWKLHDRAGGGADDLSETYTLDATGNAFEGDPSGTWTLRVSDNAGIDTGSIDSWAVLVD